MDGITGIQTDWESAPAAEAASATEALAYRRFLLEPGVENDFHATRALAQRASWASRELRLLRDQAAAAEVEAGRLARAYDDEQRRRFGFWTGMAVAAGLAAIDAVPAFLAAQAFGLDLWTTLGITVVLVAALAAAMWAVSQQESAGRWWLVVAGLAAGLAAVGALRWWYLIVTTGDQVSALIEAVGLTIFTGLLVGFGVLVLSLTRSRRVSAAERRARSLRRRANRAAVVETEVGRSAGVALREYVGRAQVFASRELDAAHARDRFVEQARREVERDGEAPAGEPG
ncbi:MAG TPA: hypothetical protein VOB72_19075 [Candidatus Dormibacteraeota bacterium]|nr:hypothetical protein [Candidatus Dormibacteraeota bacterium]